MVEGYLCTMRVVRAAEGPPLLKDLIYNLQLHIPASLSLLTTNFGLHRQDRQDREEQTKQCRLEVALAIKTDDGCRQEPNDAARGRLLC